MHGELLEFNEHLQKVLHSKDNRIRKLRLDLVDLRGPLPAEESGIQSGHINNDDESH